VEDNKKAFACGGFEKSFNLGLIPALYPELVVDVERLESLKEGLFNCPAYCHDFSRAFHGCGQGLVCGGKLIKRPPRDFCNHVVKSRFKRGGGALCNAVYDLVKGHPYCNLCSYAGNRISCCFGRKG